MNCDSGSSYPVAVRWLRLNCRSQIILAVVLLLVACPRHDHLIHVGGLAEYVGKDLQSLDEVELQAFRKKAEAVTQGDSTSSDNAFFEPRWVKPLVGGDICWAYAEVYPGYEVPDMSGVRMYLFDKHWKRLVRQIFPTGYRFFLDDIDLDQDNPLKQDLLVVKVTCTGPFLVQGNEKRPAFEQGTYQRQYYALLGRRFALVRLEDERGVLTRNNYCWESPPKGPPVPKRGRQEWIDRLNSPNIVVQLETLVWLSGMHLPSSEPRRKNVNQERAEDSERYEAVRHDSQTSQALQTLTRSPNPWVADYAKLSLQISN